MSQSQKVLRCGTPVLYTITPKLGAFKKCQRTGKSPAKQQKSLMSCGPKVDHAKKMLI